MDQRHQEVLSKYNMDTANVGWYMISYKQNFWEHLEIAKYNEVFFILCRNVLVLVFSWFMIMRPGR